MGKDKTNNNMHPYLMKVNKILENNCCAKSILQPLEQNTGVQKEYIFLGTVAILALWLAFGYGADFLCNLIGFAYPSYMSVKAIESVRKNDDAEWLMYWVVFACFTVTEYFIEFILSMVPFYYLLKCCFLIWCFLPIPNNGSKLIYYKIIRPFVLTHQSKIDDVIEKVKEKGEELKNYADSH